MVRKFFKSLKNEQTMEDVYAEVAQRIPLSILFTCNRPRTYICESIADYTKHIALLRPTEPSRFFRTRGRFAGRAIVHFNHVTHFNYDTGEEPRCDLSDLTGAVDVLVTPFIDAYEQYMGLSLAQCHMLFEKKQQAFGTATCVWHPYVPSLVLAGCTPYQRPDSETFKSDGFNLPDDIGFT